MKRRNAAGAAAVMALGVWAGWAALTTPPRAARLGDPGNWSRPQVRGAYHVHSVESDGTGSIADIGQAASRAGLDFVIVTDHGDATRVTRPPRYYHGVLCIEAVEISTADGHYVALGLPVAPYPLAGDGRDVAEDVERLGGFGIVAHPDSAKRDLQWRDWSMRVGALEWLNADSQWRDESRWKLVPTLIRYLRRPAESVASLFDRPGDVLERWDRFTQRRRVVAIAGHDAHQRLGLRRGDEPGEQRLYLRAPSYEQAFRTFSTGVELPRPLGDDASGDAAVLLESIRAGRVFTAIDAVAGPARFAFEARVGETVARMGDSVPLTQPARLSVRSNAPDPAVVSLLLNGQVVDRERGGGLEYVTDRPGVYRVEIGMPGSPGKPPVPWVLSNPVYLGVTEAPPVEPPERAAQRWSGDGGWRIEKDPGSSAGLDQALAGDGFVLNYGLAERSVSPFAAAVSVGARALAGASAISFSVSAGTPMRASAQVRGATADPDARWRRSFYADPTPRTVTLVMEDFRPVVSGLAAAAPTQTAGALLFVVDRTNSRPGERGWLRIDGLAVAR